MTVQGAKALVEKALKSNGYPLEMMAWQTINKALEEVEQYRALGTVEELKEAREKQIPQTPCIEGDGYADGHLVYDTWICPNCDAKYEIDYDDYDYCPKCGQAINKSVMEGSEEDE